MKNLYLKLLAFLLISTFLLKLPAFADLKRDSKTVSTVNGYVSVSGDNCSAATFQILASSSGGGTPTVTFQTTTTGNDWVAVSATNINTKVSATTTTAAGIYAIPIGGYNRVRAIVTSISSSGASTSITGLCTNGINSALIDGQVSFASSGGALPVTQSGTWDEVGINDSGNSITVDGTVTIGSSSGSLTVIQPTAANLNVTVTDGAGALNTIVDSGTITCNAGTDLNTSALATEATLSTLNGKVTAVDTSMVTVSGALPAGTALLGMVGIDQVTANANEVVTKAGSVTTEASAATIATNTGNSATSLGTLDNIVSGTGANISQINGETIDVGAGTEAAAIRVTLPTDGTGVLTVKQPTAADLNVTVTDGSGALNTIVDSSALPTGASTLAEQQTQTTHQATIAGDTTNIETAVQIIDDWDNGASDGASVSGDVAHDSPDAGEPVKLGAKAVPIDGTDPGEAVAEDDRVNLRGTLDGLLLVSKQHPFSWCATEEETAAVTNDEIKAAPGAGLSLHVCSFIISNGATAGDYSLKEDSGGTPVTLQGKVYTAINGGAVIHYDPCIRVTANQEIGVTSTTVTTGSYTVCGFTSP